MVADAPNRSLADWLRVLSTVPDTSEGKEFIRYALRAASGPPLVPERPVSKDMAPLDNAYVDPADPTRIRINFALLQALGDVGGDQDSRKFFRGLILHELVHWCRFNNSDKNKRSRRSETFARRMENVFHGNGDIDSPLSRPQRLETQFIERLKPFLPSKRLLASTSFLREATPRPDFNIDNRRKDMPLIRRTHIAGVPLHYDRFNQDGSDYGTIGKPVNPYINAEFAEKCDAAFSDIKVRLEPRFGMLDAIVTGGIGRSGSGKSYHHQSRAFDLDALAFRDGTLWVANSFPNRSHLYIAIESELRRHFGVVLTYDYNAAHQDHMHFDESRDAKFRSSAKTHTLYVQHAVKNVYLRPVGVDGLWGPETEDAVDDVLSELDIGPLSKKANWLAFCEVTAMHAVEMAD